MSLEDLLARDDLSEDVWRRIETALNGQDGDPGVKHCRELIQAIPDMVYRLDTAGRFLFVNPAARDFGFSPESLVGRHFSEILHPEEIPTGLSSLPQGPFAGNG